MRRTRGFAGAAIAALALLTAALPARAQGDAWPSRPITIVAPFGPGSTPDAVARLLADHFKTAFGQNAVVENRTGAGGNLGTQAVATAAPDGYTLGVSIAGPLAINTVLFPDLAYDPERDLAFISLVATQPSVIVVNPELGIASTDDLIERLKADPGGFNFASIGVGSLSHLAMEALAEASGTEMTHVPYNGSPQAVQALLGGEAQLGALPAGAVVPFGRSGELAMVAVSSAKRFSLLPDVPTLSEDGLAGVEADAWVGLIAPAGTDPAILARIGDETRSFLATPQARAALEAQFMEPAGSSAETFEAVVQGDLDRWRPLIERRGITLN
ncbi:Bug family tripartite tricarboxylate transporter substrate binding protein [Marinivivus vitaminiproducens]|uniref:Bug family tripartite tricarboxylate transporter substrate binding protein n=1 Tax=Marinivivus vitaminiproducens TaxID=3035935 RepID=UPI002798E201|nr:tripartite tricarboxylate transporter substrate binding protein [Geminicoccaceae bacterium SCSIO 64248]